MVLNLLTKFVIIKLWANILWLWRFDLGFWQSSKKIYGKLQYRGKDFWQFQGLSRFPRKMVFYSSTKFGIMKPWTNIPWLRIFDWGFWQTSKQIFRKLQYRKKVFEELQGFLRFPWKMVLSSLTKFGIIRTWTNIPWLRLFDLGLWQTSKQIYRKLQYRENVVEKFQGLPHFSREMVL